MKLRVFLAGVVAIVVVAGVAWKIQPRSVAAKLDCEKIITALKAGANAEQAGRLREDLRDCLRTRQVDYYEVADLF